MTANKLKEAFEKELPIIAKIQLSASSYEERFEKISGLICRKKNGRKIISAELYDKSGHSVIIVSAKNVLRCAKE